MPHPVTTEKGGRRRAGETTGAMKTPPSPISVLAPFVAMPFAPSSVLLDCICFVLGSSGLPHPMG